jgi:ferrous iron transport protein B
VYGLLIAALIPARAIGPFNLQGLVLFSLYAAGILSALLVAFVMKQFSASRQYSPLMLELPDFQWPHAGNLLLGLWERVKIFMSRVGGIILALMIVLWFLSSYPVPPPGATGPAIQYSFAGKLGALLEHVFAPQCLSTLAVVKRETNSWRYPLIMAGYLFALAYLASFITYRVVLAWA